MKWYGIVAFCLSLYVAPAWAQQTLPPPGGGFNRPTSPSTTRPTTPGTSGSSGAAPRTSGGTTAGGVGGTAAGSGVNSRPLGAAPGTTRPATTVPGTAGGTAGSAAPGTMTARDYASYAIGLDMAARFQAEGTPVNLEQLVQGMRDGFSGQKPRYAEEQLRAAADAFDKEMQARAQERYKLISEKMKRDGALFLAENKKKRTVKTTASGLQYEVLKAGVGKSPRSTDRIKAHYHGTLTDGSVFDTTQNDEPVEIDVQAAIPGWTEALQMMKVGDKWRLYVPSELAYGTEGFGPVPPNAVLIFDLELLDVATTSPGTLPPPTGNGSGGPALGLPGNAPAAGSGSAARSSPPSTSRPQGGSAVPGGAANRGAAPAGPASPPRTFK